MPKCTQMTWRPGAASSASDLSFSRTYCPETLPAYMTGREVKVCLNTDSSENLHRCFSGADASLRAAVTSASRRTANAMPHNSGRRRIILSLCVSSPPARQSRCARRHSPRQPPSLPHQPADSRSIRLDSYRHLRMRPSMSLDHALCMSVRRAASCAMHEHGLSGLFCSTPLAHIDVASDRCNSP